MADYRITSGWMQSSLIRTITGENSRFHSAYSRITQIIAAHLASTADKAVAYSVYDDILASCPGTDPVPLIATFILLGFDRFSIAFTNLLMELAQDSQLQDEICQEIREHQRYFLKSDKLTNFVQQQLPAHPIISAVTKSLPTAVPLNGFFIPPENGVLLFLNNLDSHRKLMEDSMAAFDDCLTMNLMRIFVGEFVVRFKFQLKESKAMEVGCGVSLRRKGVNVCVRNRY